MSKFISPIPYEAAVALWRQTRAFRVCALCRQPRAAKAADELQRNLFTAAKNEREFTS